jgi:hypothetical protein
VFDIEFISDEPELQVRGRVDCGVRRAVVA